MKEKEYKLNIDPRILELLGPSLYTNIYYVLAELIANAYDADAHNVYIIWIKAVHTANATISIPPNNKTCFPLFFIILRPFYNWFVFSTVSPYQKT